MVSRCSVIVRVHFLSWVAWGRCSSAMRPESGFHRADYGSKQRVQIGPSGFFGRLCQWGARCDPFFFVCGDCDAPGGQESGHYPF